jgi:hypothetical protein
MIGGEDVKAVAKSALLKIATLFGNLAIMTGNTGFRPITLRRQLSLVLPVRRSGNHDRQNRF